MQEPSASTDAPKLLEAGRAEFAILDIHDLGLARERGLDVVGIAPIVQRPLAAVLVDPTDVRRPRDLEGRTVGVTGLPSDDAVLDSVLEADGADPDAVDRVTIGFNAVASLAAGRVDAATAFWNAEGVTLSSAGHSDSRVSRRRLRRPALSGAGPLHDLRPDRGPTRAWSARWSPPRSGATGSASMRSGPARATSSPDPGSTAPAVSTELRALLSSTP